jgi:hypothetical protein
MAHRSTANQVPIIGNLLPMPPGARTQAVSSAAPAIHGAADEGRL